MLTRERAADGVTVLTLDRPQKRNALSIELRLALAEHLRILASDAAVRCTVITGAPPDFCAGMDTTQFGAGERLLEANDAFFGALVEHPKPLVAAVNGHALGGGFALALLCDLRIAGEGARLGFPEVRRGIPPSYAAARAVVAPGVARELCLTGRVLRAAEALRLGVVTATVPDAGLREAAIAQASELAALLPGALATLKAWAADDAPWRALAALEREALRDAVLRRREGAG